MNFNLLIKHRLLTLVAFMMAGNMGSSLILANEVPIISGEQVKPLETSTGKSQDLGTVEAQGDQQWIEKRGDTAETYQPIIDYKLDINSLDTSPSVNQKKEDEDWQNLHRGDPKSQGGGLPLLKF